MRHDPAQTWMWTMAKVARGAVEKASAQKVRGIFDRLRCMEQVYRMQPRGHYRKKALQALEKHLQEMIVKFRERRRGGGAVQNEGQSGVLRFALRHPFVMTRAYRKAKKSGQSFA